MSTRPIIKRAIHRGFELGQRLGIDVLPRHFYSSIPNIRTLRAESTWRAPYTMADVQGAGIDDQLEFLRRCCAAEPVARLGGSLDVYDAACRENGAPGYGPIEALVLYCFIGSLRPAKVIQIGAGVSTSLVLRSAREAGYRPHVVCVDPYPTPMLRDLARRDEIKLIEQPAQAVPAEELASLSDGDLLFIDSTHTVKPGSEVTRLMLEVLPRLPSGAYAHFHDILFPYDYSPTVLDEDLFFWEESVLLHAFLCGSTNWRLELSLSMIHHARALELQTLLPQYQPARFEGGLLARPASGSHFPSAAFLRRT